jgi:hypothetical protein
MIDLEILVLTIREFIIKSIILYQKIKLRSFHLKAVRMLSGGLWLHFTDGSWVKCKWANTTIKGYINNPHDGGMFHESFVEIVKLENYKWGQK